MFYNSDTTYHYACQLWESLDKGESEVSMISDAEKITLTLLAIFVNIVKTAHTISPLIECTEMNVRVIK